MTEGNIESAGEVLATMSMENLRIERDHSSVICQKKSENRISKDKDLGNGNGTENENGRG